MTLTEPRVNIEQEILTQLLYNDPYARNVGPHLKKEYFVDTTNAKIFDEYETYLAKYASVPTREALILELETRTDLDQGQINAACSKLDECKRLSEEPVPDLRWLVDTTEQYCQDRAIYLGIMKSVAVLEGEDVSVSKTGIPDILSEAIGVSFDRSIGHEYFEQASERWDFMHREETRLEFDLEWLNKITSGGLPKKTLTVLLAPTNAGKTLVKCSLAASFIKKGYNVLYITMEMAEERISERIDANILDVNLDDLEMIARDAFTTKVTAAASKAQGRLFVKEFPTASAHAGHIRHLLDELKVKKQFVPDIVFVDYLNICTSARMSDVSNTYSMVKSIAEELRGLAVEKDMAFFTSTQTNRGAWGATDIDLADTSESAGLPATADMMLALIVSDQLNQMGQIVLKQLKNRFSDVTHNITSAFNIDRPKMRITDVEDSSGEYNPKPDVRAPSISKMGRPEKSKSTESSSPWKTTPMTNSNDDDDPFAGFQM